MKLSLFMCFFSFLFLKYPWKIFILLHPLERFLLYQTPLKDFYFIKHPWKIFILLNILERFLFYWTPLKDSYLKDSYFPILLTLWFRYLKIYVKENCMHFSSQLFFKTLHITLKFQEKSKKNAFASNLQT